MVRGPSSRGPRRALIPRAMDSSSAQSSAVSGLAGPVAKLSSIMTRSRAMSCSR
jgi:hypothetical protein